MAGAAKQDSVVRTGPLLLTRGSPAIHEIVVSFIHESCARNALPPRKIAGSLFICVYTLFEFSQLKGISPRFYSNIYKNKRFINIIIIYATKSIFC